MEVPETQNQHPALLLLVGQALSPQCIEDETEDLAKGFSERGELHIGIAASPSASVVGGIFGGQLAECEFPSFEQQSQTLPQQRGHEGARTQGQGSEQSVGSRNEDILGALECIIARIEERAMSASRQCLLAQIACHLVQTFGRSSHVLEDDVAIKLFSVLVNVRDLFGLYPVFTSSGSWDDSRLLLRTVEKHSSTPFSV